MPATKYPKRGGGSIAVAWRNIGPQRPCEHPAPNALAAELIKARGGVLPACLPGPDMYDWEPQR